MRAGVLALRRRLDVVVYSIRPARPWRFPAASSAQPDSFTDPGLLLEGYLVGELAAADRDRFESWVALDEARARTVAALRHPHDHDSGGDVSKWWTQCAAVLRAPEGEHIADTVDLPGTTPGTTELRIGTAVSVTTRWWHIPAAWAGLAASILCVAIGSWTLHARHDVVSTTASAPEHSYATARGERAVLTLDGATVVLGPESVLRISGNYGVHDRTISLTGHAYFDVVHDSAHPFRVWAHGVLTEDLGTRFDIRAYAHDSAMQLVVAAGQVAVRPRRAPSERSHSVASLVAPVLVTPGMMATTNGDGVVRVRSGLDARRYLSWTDGRLTFADTPLPEAAAEIGRWYDLDIRLGDRRLASRTLTASFDDPPAAVLVALEGALGVRAIRAGRVITLYPP